MKEKLFYLCLIKCAGLILLVVVWWELSEKYQLKNDEIDFQVASAIYSDKKNVCVFYRSILCWYKKIANRVMGEFGMRKWPSQQSR